VRLHDLNGLAAALRAGLGELQVKRLIQLAGRIVGHVEQMWRGAWDVLDDDQRQPDDDTGEG